ncbi:hypothetical protein PHJA_002278800 [Phtheirospermum japonicum]|uniref:DUF4005 domain-containing protein n=1 Tax=Phtheirospermum japonicum TaxID=374723 RepID=A0A830CUP7_9LAMI|nr:hypothetical protein PHJA_002278800 [Phtheirospermum japonicum]
MGKASKWFRALLGLKNADPNHGQSQKPPPKKKWSFAKSHREKDPQKPRQSVAPGGGDDDDDASRHAIAVAAATAAVAEAAVAAAQAAAAVVQLTSSGRSISTAGGDGGELCGSAHVTRRGGGYVSRDEWAAVMIQSHFRAYLSRRALRALKALVKLQALVRGHLVRKQTAYALRRLQALVRAQARARAGRVLNSESPQSSMKSSHFNYQGPATPEKSERVTRARSMKHEQSPLKRSSSKSNSSINYNPERSHNSTRIRLDTRMVDQISYLHTEDDKSDKNLELDNQNCRSFSTLSKESTARCQSGPSPSSGEAQSPSPLENVDESAFCTADNSPTFYSASSRGGSSRKGPFTPTKSDGSRSCFSNYSDHPNYMAFTESSKAKVRSLSAPKQRPFERSSSTKRYSIHGYGDSRATNQRVSSLQANFTSKAYPGSGRLDRLGMPISGFNGDYWHRY